jgi:hypothetical protein
LILSFEAQRAEDAARLKQRGTEPLGDFAKRFATLDGGPVRTKVSYAANYNYAPHEVPQTSLLAQRYLPLHVECTRS